MAVSVSLMAIIISLHLIAFVLAVGSERRRSTVTPFLFALLFFFFLFKSLFIVSTVCTPKSSLTLWLSFSAGQGGA